MEAVTVSGFDQNIIGLGEYLGGAEDHIAIAAYVAAEGEMGLFSFLLYLQVDGSAADDMARIGLEDLYVFVDGMPGVIVYADKAVHGAFGVFFVVQGREVRESIGGPAFVGKLCIFFLDAGGIFEQNAGEFPRRGGAEDFAVEAVLYQLRDEAAMVNMCMG